MSFAGIDPVPVQLETNVETYAKAWGRDQEENQGFSWKWYCFYESASTFNSWMNSECVRCVPTHFKDAHPPRTPSATAPPYQQFEQSEAETVHLCIPALIGFSCWDSTWDTNQVNPCCWCLRKALPQLLWRRNIFGWWRKSSDALASESCVSCCSFLPMIRKQRGFVDSKDSASAEWLED